MNLTLTLVLAIGIIFIVGCAYVVHKKTGSAGKVALVVAISLGLLETILMIGFYQFDILTVLYNFILSVVVGYLIARYLYGRFLVKPP